MPNRPVVLLVEDEALIRMSISDVLDEAGYRVIEASCSDEAMAIIDARTDVRALVTDVRMPGQVDGFALARIAASMRPGIGIVVMSGHADGSAPMPQGARFFPKPFVFGELRAALDELVRH